MRVPAGFYTVTRVALETRLSDRTIRDLCSSGAIEGARRHGRRTWLVPESFVRGFLASSERCPTCGRCSADGADTGPRLGHI